MGLFTSITKESTRLLAAARGEGILVPSFSVSVLVGSGVLQCLAVAVAEHVPFLTIGEETVWAFTETRLLLCNVLLSLSSFSFF